MNLWYMRNNAILIHKILLINVLDHRVLNGIIGRNFGKQLRTAIIYKISFNRKFLRRSARLFLNTFLQTLATISTMQIYLTCGRSVWLQTWPSNFMLTPIWWKQSVNPGLSTGRNSRLSSFWTSSMTFWFFKYNPA